MKYLDIIPSELLESTAIDERYRDSPFRNLKTLPPKVKGSRYESITEIILRDLGFEVLSPKNTDHDRIVDGEKCEIKGSMLNKNSDVFSFLQIRPDQEYDKIVFTLIYPHDILILEMDKSKAIENIDKGHFKKQHGGDKSESRTFMFYGNENDLLQLGARFINEPSTEK